MLSPDLGSRPASKPLSRRGASDIAYAQVRQLIEDGELQPGVCVSEKELVSRLELGRTPLRESIKVLVAQGFMVRLPNGRLMVAPVTVRGLQDLFATRLAIERLIMESVVSESSDDQILGALGPIADGIQRALEGPLLEARFYGERFHYAMAEICPNKVASTILWQLRDRIGLYRRIGPDRSVQRRIQAARDHLKLYELVRTRQLAEAVALLEEHIRAAQEVAIGFLSGTSENGQVPPQPAP